MGTLITAALMTIGSVVNPDAPPLPPSPTPTPIAIVAQANPVVDEDNAETLTGQICFCKNQIALTKQNIERQKKITKASGVMDMRATYALNARLIDLAEAGNERGAEYYKLTGKDFNLKKCDEE